MGALTGGGAAGACRQAPVRGGSCPGSSGNERSVPAPSTLGARSLRPAPSPSFPGTCSPPTHPAFRHPRGSLPGTLSPFQPPPLAAFPPPAAGPESAAVTALTWEARRRAGPAPAPAIGCRPRHSRAGPAGATRAVAEGRAEPGFLKEPLASCCVTVGRWAVGSPRAGRPPDTRDGLPPPIVYPPAVLCCRSLRKEVPFSPVSPGGPGSWPGSLRDPGTPICPSQSGGSSGHHLFIPQIVLQSCSGPGHGRRGRGPQYSKIRILGHNGHIISRNTSGSIPEK